MIVNHVMGVPIYSYTLFTMLLFMAAAYVLGVLQGNQRRW